MEIGPGLVGEFNVEIGFVVPRLVVSYRTALPREAPDYRGWLTDE